MSCSVEVFHELPHNKQHNTNPYGLQYLIQNYHLYFDPKLGHGKCAIRRIPCACNACTDQLGFPWNQKNCDDKQPRYQLTKCFVYSYVLGEINKCNIITLKNKDTDEK